MTDLRIRIEHEFRGPGVIRGGVFMLGVEDAIRMVERARELGVAILGIDVFRLTASTTQPDSGLILDLSLTGFDRAKSWDNAAQFLRPHVGADLYCEVVLDHKSD